MSKPDKTKVLPVHILREMFRVAAPEVTVSECCGHLNITNPADEVPSEIAELEGQRIRLVPTHAAGGDANPQGGRKP